MARRAGPGVRGPVSELEGDRPGLEPRRLWRGFVRGNVFLALSHLLSLVNSVFLARGLPPDRFGMLAFATAMASYAGLFSRWGTDISLVRDMARAGAGHQAALLDALALRLRLAAIALLAFAAPSWVLSSPIKASILTAMILGQLILVLDLGPLFDREGRTERHVLLSTSRQGLYTGLVFVSVTLASGDLALIAVGASWVLTSALFVAQSWRDGRLPTNLVEKALLQRTPLQLARRNLPAFVSLLAHQCYVNLDLVLISVLLGDRILAPYAVASALAQAALGSTGLLHRLLQPSLVEAIRVGRGPTTYRKCLLVAAAGSSLVGAGLFVAAPALVRGFYPAPMAEAGALARFFSLWVVLGGVGGVSAFCLIALGRDRSYLASVLAGASGNLFLNFLLIPRYGVWGAAWATVASQAVSSALAFAASGDLLLRATAFGSPLRHGMGSGLRAPTGRK